MRGLPVMKYILGFHGILACGCVVNCLVGSLLRGGKEREENKDDAKVFW